MSALAEALAALKAHLGTLQAVQIVAAAVEQAGDLPTLIAALQEECEALTDARDLLRIEVATLRKERERGKSHE